VHGIVERVPATGKLRFAYRSARWRDRFSAMLPDHSHENSRRILDPADSMVEAEGCRCCGVRELPVEDLIEAFEEGRSKMSL
jgi:hypothetical protein